MASFGFTTNSNIKWETTSQCNDNVHESSVKIPLNKKCMMLFSDLSTPKVLEYLTILFSVGIVICLSVITANIWEIKSNLES